MKKYMMAPTATNIRMVGMMLGLSGAAAGAASRRAMRKFIRIKLRE